MDIEPLLLTDKQAAKMLQICTRTLKRYAVAGKIRRCYLTGKPGKGCRYSLAELQRFVRACEEGFPGEGEKS